MGWRGKFSLKKVAGYIKVWLGGMKLYMGELYRGKSFGFDRKFVLNCFVWHLDVYCLGFHYYEFRFIINFRYFKFIFIITK